MGSLRSIQDIVVQEAIEAKNRNFHPSPEAWEDQFIYFLLPDRFSNGQEQGYKDNEDRVVQTGSIPLYTPADNGNAIKDEAAVDNWLDAGNKFVGGTIKGITSKLGYLKRMGVTAVWLGPIFKQVAKLETYHGYGVQNFLDVDPRFGTKEELRELVNVAHSMGLYVIQDIILNHSGNVFEYTEGNPGYDNGKVYPVKGFYDEDRQSNIPFGPIDEQKFPNAFPNAAIWPAELQEHGNFTCEGQINGDGWDKSPQYLDGDFYDLKDITLGENDPDNFNAPPALKTLTTAYKFWISWLDLDGYRVDTVKHMGWGPTRYFSESIHEFCVRIGKDNFMIVGEITGNMAFETVEATGIDAALGIGNTMQSLWQLPRGEADAITFFSQFRNAAFLNKGSQQWLRNKIFTMIDDHDQVWKGDLKGRFCSSSPGPQLMFPALALNLCTIGIPCMYYGSEQQFDGSGGSGRPGHGSDQYIREAMFGGEYGAFRSRGVHFFNEDSPVYQQLAELNQMRKQEIALRRGRQYLREISGDGDVFGYPSRWGGRMLSVVAWSRIFDGTEVLCALNTDEQNAHEAWVTVDYGIQAEGNMLQNIFPGSFDSIKVATKNGRRAVLLKVPAAGFVLYK